MRDRLEAMRRVLAVQQQVKRLAEWRLAAIGQQTAELTDARTALDRFVEGADLPGGLAGLALRQRSRLAERQAASERERPRPRRSQPARPARWRVSPSGSSGTSTARSGRRKPAATSKPPSRPSAIARLTTAQACGKPLGA